MSSKNDRIMGILGFFVLLIALVGTAMFEGEAPEGDSQLFNVKFSENSETLFDEGDYTEEGETTELGIDITKMNLTTMDFALTWTDDDTSEANVGGLGVQNQPDEFRLTIVTPEGEEYSQQAASDINTEQGTIMISTPLFEPDIQENQTEMTASSEKALEKKLTSNIGMGNWTVNVECVEAGDSETSTGQTTASDDGNEWHLEVTGHFYTAKIGEGAIPTK